MGLISSLLLFPVAGPIQGLEFILEQIREEAEAAMFDEGRMQAELYELNLRRDLGEISDDEYEKLETELLERLSAIRSYREALTVPGAPLEDEG
ncbi:MAG TPA: gas vesicle protein GvpG [Thermomicrobiaceae bacterium]|nr:gas vesicle protein GvpG [Thermomicrobiaceae bacterium]